MRRARPRRRSALRLGAAGLVGLAALLLVLRLGAPLLLQEKLSHAIEQAGWGPVEMQLDWNGLFGLRASHVQLGPSGALTADHADLSLSPAGLAAGRLDALTIVGLAVKARVDASGRIVLENLPPFALSGGTAARTPLAIARVRLEQTQIEAATPAGAVSAVIDGTVLAGPDGPAIDGTLAITLGTTRVTLPSLAITPQSGGWRVRAEHAEARDATHGILLQDIAVTLDWQGAAATFDAKIGTAQDLLGPARFPTASLTLHAERQGDRIDFSVAAAAEKSRLRLAAKGRHDLASGRGSAEIASTIPPFQAHGLQPRDLSPLLAKDLPPIEGKLAVSGPITWNGTRVVPHLRLEIEDLAGKFGTVELSGGHGALLLDSLMPPATPPGQAFAGTLSVPGLEHLPLDARFQLRPDGALHVETLALGLADGTLGLGDLLFKPSEGLPAALALPVRVDNVELGMLLKLVDIDGLSGQGRLDGLLPLRLVMGPGGAWHLLLEKGHVEARAGGQLRYVGNGLPEQSGGGSQSVALLRDVLKEFHYRGLAAELDQGADGTGGILLHLDGSNPAVLNGRRFLLNIRLDANFDRLAQIFLSALDAAQTLTRNGLAPQR